ncbi:MAG: hypothetical protein KDK61_09115 [Simkania sp.]|nr:hypothetical protein [Simkania sp.]
MKLLARIEDVVTNGTGFTSHSLLTSRNTMYALFDSIGEIMLIPLKKIEQQKVENVSYFAMNFKDLDVKKIVKKQKKAIERSLENLDRRAEMVANNRVIIERHLDKMYDRNIVLKNLFFKGPYNGNN